MAERTVSRTSGFDGSSRYESDPCALLRHQPRVAYSVRSASGARHAEKHITHACTRMPEPFAAEMHAASWSPDLPKSFDRGSTFEA